MVNGDADFGTPISSARAYRRPMEPWRRTLKRGLLHLHNAGARSMPFPPCRLFRTAGGRRSRRERPWGEAHHGVGFTILLRFMIGMVDDVPDDSVNAKRWFNDVRNVPFSGFFDGSLIGLYVFLPTTTSPFAVRPQAETRSWISAGLRPLFSPRQQGP